MNLNLYRRRHWSAWSAGVFFAAHTLVNHSIFRSDNGAAGLLNGRLRGPGHLQHGEIGMEQLLAVVFAALSVVLGMVSFQDSQLPSRAAALPAQRNRPDTLGTIRGKVWFRGAAIPQPTVIENTTDPHICGSRQSFDDILISKTTR